MRFGFWGMVALMVAVGGCEYSTAPAKKGGPGESCLARNDCEKELSCINNVCIDSNVPIDKAPKECDLIECTKKSDCCDADEDCRCTDEQCEFFTSCEDDFDCDFANPVCIGGECGQCEADSDCGFESYCVAKRCVECKNDGHCDGDEMCVDNFCDSGCDRDEQCGALEACKDSECVHVGCKSDRECIAYLNSPRATCGEDKECSVLCETDAECNADGFSFSACHEGVCTFLGCETHADCRALFDRTAFDGQLALCREPQD